MDQLIGSYKEFIVIERKKIDEIEKTAKLKLEANIGRPLSESSIEAKAVLDVVKYIKENNIYTQDFQIKN